MKKLAIVLGLLAVSMVALASAPTLLDLQNTAAVLAAQYKQKSDLCGEMASPTVLAADQCKAQTDNLKVQLDNASIRLEAAASPSPSL